MFNVGGHDATVAVVMLWRSFGTGSNLNDDLYQGLLCSIPEETNGEECPKPRRNSFSGQELLPKKKTGNERRRCWLWKGLLQCPCVAPQLGAVPAVERTRWYVKVGCSSHC